MLAWRSVPDFDQLQLVCSLLQGALQHLLVLLLLLQQLLQQPAGGSTAIHPCGSFWILSYFFEVCTGWFLVSASPAVRSAGDVSAGGPESGGPAARWGRWRGRPPPLNLQHEGLKREQTPPPLHLPRLPSLLLHTRTTDRSGSAVLQKQRLETADQSHKKDPCLELCLQDGDKTPHQAAAADSTWDEDGDGGLNSSPDDVIHRKHPVRFDVMVPQDFVDLKNGTQQRNKWEKNPLNEAVE